MAESQSERAVRSDAGDRRLLRYCLELAYDGTGFFGWQSQPHGNTVQDSLEASLSNVLPGTGRLVPASRTDTGVDAATQFAMFGVPVPIKDPATLALELGRVVDPRITVKSCFPVAQSFHPSAHARSKLYRYSIWLNPSADGVRRPDAWRIYDSLRVDQLGDDLRAIAGEHDFTTFCAGDCDAPTRVRSVLDTWMTRDGEVIHLWFHGRGFLKQMVRILVGTIVERASRRRALVPFAELITGRDRRHAARTAPAQGLTLVQIYY